MTLSWARLERSNWAIPRGRHGSETFYGVWSHENKPLCSVFLWFLHMRTTSAMVCWVDAVLSYFTIMIWDLTWPAWDKIASWQSNKGGESVLLPEWCLSQVLELPTESERARSTWVMKVSAKGAFLLMLLSTAAYSDYNKRISFSDWMTNIINREGRVRSKSTWASCPGNVPVKNDHLTKEYKEKK